MRCNTIHTIRTRFRVFRLNHVILFLQIIIVNSHHIHYNIVHKYALFGHIIYGRNLGMKREFAVCMSIVAVVTSGDYVCTVYNNTPVFLYHQTFFGFCYSLLDIEIVLVHSMIYG
jgi:hypothetical protein